MADDQTKVVPLAFNHVGITVPNIFDAIDWYGRVFGATHIMGPRIIASSARETSAIFGPRFRKAYQAHLLLANGVGLELFQFVEPAVQSPAENMPYWNRGLFHLAVTHPNVDDLARRIAESGGRKRHEPIDFVRGKQWRLCYCEDPWGSVIEIMSHSYAEIFANWPQPGMTEKPEFLLRP